MEVSTIYLETKSRLDEGYRRLVHQGGQWSGKTVNILAALAHLACTDTEPSVTTVTAQSFPVLRSGALRDFENYVLPEIHSLCRYNKAEHTFIFANGSVLEFKTFDHETKARGAKRKRLFVNEANTFDYMTWFQLDSRSEQSIIDYNPTIRFWAHDKVIGEKGSLLLISDHRHNPFLSADKHREIESIKDNELWKVYARGATGNVVGLVFPNWNYTLDFPEDLEWIFGIDYGFTNDPTAIVRVAKLADCLYIDEISYQTGAMTPTSIRDILNTFGAEGSIVYSEHVPEIIRQLKILGINIIPARKGPGSIKAGIEKIKEYTVYYRGRNIKRETGLYIWEKDELGNSTNVPVDANNHAIDATRYATFSHWGLRNIEN